LEKLHSGFEVIIVTAAFYIQFSTTIDLYVFAILIVEVENEGAEDDNVVIDSSPIE
jgi:hypothetical protein